MLMCRAKQGGQQKVLVKPQRPKTSACRKEKGETDQERKEEDPPITQHPCSASSQQIKGDTTEQEKPLLPSGRTGICSDE